MKYTLLVLLLIHIPASASELSKLITTHCTDGTKQMDKDAIEILKDSSSFIKTMCHDTGDDGDLHLPIKLKHFETILNYLKKGDLPNLQQLDIKSAMDLADAASFLDIKNLLHHAIDRACGIPIKRKKEILELLRNKKVHDQEEQRLTEVLGCNKDIYPLLASQMLLRSGVYAYLQLPTSVTIVDQGANDEFFSFTSLVMAVNKELLACNTRDSIHLYKNNKTDFTFSSQIAEDGEPWVLAFHNALLVSGHRSQKVSLWDANTSKKMAQFDISLLGRDSQVINPVINIECSGDLLLCSEFYGQQIHALDIRSHSKAFQLCCPSKIMRLASNENFLAAGLEDRTTAIFDITAGKQLTQLKYHTAPVYSLAWNKKKNLLATGSLDGSACIWDGRTYRLKKQLKRQGQAVSSLAWHDDLLAGNSGKGVNLFDGDSGEKLVMLETRSSCKSLQFLENQLFCVCGIGCIDFWDTSTIFATLKNMQSYQNLENVLTILCAKNRRLKSEYSDPAHQIIQEITNEGMRNAFQKYLDA